MVYNTQNYWVSGLCPSSAVLNARKHNADPVIEVGSFSKGSQQSRFHPPLHSFRNLCFLVFRIPDDGQSPETQWF
jgi:hypothetical protein